MTPHGREVARSITGLSVAALVGLGLLAAMLTGCATPARPLGPYTMPRVSGRTGMPPAPPTYGCRPTRTYPTPIAGECV